MEVAKLFVKISADAKDALNTLKTVDDKFKTTGINIAKVGAGMTAGITVPLVMAGTKAFEMAGQFEDALGATDQIFKDSSAEVQDWASSLETYYGVAETEALGYANIMGAMMQNIGGMTEEESAKMSGTLVELAGDLSAMFGGTTQDAVQALTGALKGNNTMLDNYGMGVNEATIKTKALELGLIKNGEEMSLTAKQAATLALIMEQTADVTGQASRESEGASGTVKTLKTEMANLTKTLGEELLPIIVPIIKDIVDLVKRFSEMDDGTKKLIVQIGLFLAVAGPVITTIGGIISAVGVVIGWFGGFVSILSTLFGFLLVGVGQVIPLFAGAIAFLVSPIGLAIAGVVALIAIGVALWKNWDVVKEKASALWKSIKDIFGKIGDFVSGIFENFKRVIKLPTISVSGSLNPATWLRSGLPKLNVSWNADGGIFSRPTIFNTPSGLQGVGEAGAEVIMPLSRLDSMLSDRGQIDYERMADVMVDAFRNVGIELDKKEVGTFVDKRIMKGAY